MPDNKTFFFLKVGENKARKQLLCIIRKFCIIFVYCCFENEIFVVHKIQFYVIHIKISSRRFVSSLNKTMSTDYLCSKIQMESNRHHCVRSTAHSLLFFQQFLQLGYQVLCKSGLHVLALPPQVL